MQKYQIKPVIGQVFAWEEANQALEAMGKSTLDKAGKIVVQV